MTHRLQSGLHKSLICLTSENIMGWYDRLQRKISFYLGALDDWATRAHLAQTYLLMVNFFLALKASSNILAILSNSTSLILDYNGLTLFSHLFGYCFVSLNLLVFLSSLLCLLALMLTMKHNSLRLLLINCFTFSQIFLIAITMILMARLWLAPIKLDLSKDIPNWRDEIRGYDYRLPRSSIVSLFTSSSYSTGDSLDVESKSVQQAQSAQVRTKSVDETDSVNLFSPTKPTLLLKTNKEHKNDEDDHLLHTTSTGANQRRAAIEIHGYSRHLDRLQQTLGCCGVLGPSDWVTYNTEWGLLAPSCCRHPRALKTRRRGSNSTDTTTGVGIEEAAATTKEAYRRAISAHSRGASMVSMSGNGGEDETVGNFLVGDGDHDDYEGLRGVGVGGGDPLEEIKTAASEDGAEIIYYCPMVDEPQVPNEPATFQPGGGGSGVTTNSVTGASNAKSRRSPQHGARLRPEELLEIQLAIEWTGGSSRSGRFHLNQQQQQQQLSIVYGCQRTMDEREARCLFGLRLSLLILVSFSFLNVIARSAAFEANRKQQQQRDRTMNQRRCFHQAGARCSRIVTATMRPATTLVTASLTTEAAPQPLAA